MDDLTELILQECARSERFQEARDRADKISADTRLEDIDDEEVRHIVWQRRNFSNRIIRAASSRNEPIPYGGDVSSDRIFLPPSFRARAWGR